ncbi:MAG: carbonic anhydrase [Oligoflexia bacterium]|nr:carbonic anhydrase [Oligoflexia bacterium]
MFSKGLGEIFVIRVAGNVVDPIILGSIEYAVEHLHVPLIMILGHSKCGAVTAACDDGDGGDSNIASIINAIKPAVKNIKSKKGKNIKKNNLVEWTIEENIKINAKKMLEDSKIIREFVEQEKVKIVLAQYDLYSGAVSIIKD